MALVVPEDDMDMEEEEIAPEEVEEDKEVDMEEAAILVPQIDKEEAKEETREEEIAPAARILNPRTLLRAGFQIPEKKPIMKDPVIPTLKTRKVRMGMAPKRSVATVADARKSQKMAHREMGSLW